LPLLFPAKYASLIFAGTPKILLESTASAYLLKADHPSLGTICYHLDMKRLTLEEIDSYSTDLTSWTIEKDKLYKEFIFKDFTDAFTFMKLFAEVAESINHHPDWTNSYNKVAITLSSHDVGGLTKKDITLAQEADRIACITP